MGKQCQTLFLGAPKSLQMVAAAMKLKDAYSLEEKLWPAYARQHIKEQGRYFANKSPSSQSHWFSNSHVQMWELDLKEGWVLKNWCFWTVVLEKTLESPLDCKEIQPVRPGYSLEGLMWSWNSSTLTTWCEEQTSFNFMAAITICIDFGAQEK